MSVILQGLSFLFMICPAFSIVKGPQVVLDCAACEKLSKDLAKGLVKTAKRTFGREQSARANIGPYATSETRLIEIIEEFCEKDARCKTFYAENDDHIDDWWLNNFVHNQSANFYTDVCVNAVKVCCEKGYHGPECDKCDNCTSYGKCIGGGTRYGSGKCICNDGYGGTWCERCQRDHFTSYAPNGTLLCGKCDKSCNGLCFSTGSAACSGVCGRGWRWIIEVGCVDVAECSRERVCKPNQYCVERPGSYLCKKCTKGCDRCSTAGLKDTCQLCSTGFSRNATTGECHDLDECVKLAPCQGENEECQNKPGSFKCTCKSGFHRKDGKCVEGNADETEVDYDDYDDDFDF